MHTGPVEIIAVQTPSTAYRILVGAGVSRLEHPELSGAGTVLLVTDDRVAPRYLDAWATALRRQGLGVHPVVIPAGEPSKNLAQAEALYAEAARARLERRSAVVALGGGVIGDLAGFVAATYLRGLRLVQIPTTLLAMVDSAVGGKTAVNIPAGKNLVGAFHHPCLVLADPAVLATLPEAEFRSGLAEVVKYGLIRDRTFLEQLERDADVIRRREPAILQSVVARCCRIKAAVVGADERECGERAVLNFGHTLGHALEHAGGYGAMSHGAAVAVGMRYAARLSQMQTGLRSDDVARAEALLDAMGLPCPDLQAWDWNALRNSMRMDKKSAGGEPRWVLLEALGHARHGCSVTPEGLHEVWKRFAARSESAPYPENNHNTGRAGSPNTPTQKCGPIENC